MPIAVECSDASTRPHQRRPPVRQPIAGLCPAGRALPDVGAIPMCLVMSHGFRDVILVVCALICAGTAIYVVYNIEVFKHRYDLQFLQQPDQQQ
jgi:hypothetical protein